MSTGFGRNIHFIGIDEKTLKIIGGYFKAKTILQSAFQCVKDGQIYQAIIFTGENKEPA